MARLGRHQDLTPNKTATEVNPIQVVLLRVHVTTETPISPQWADGIETRDLRDLTNVIGYCIKKALADIFSRGLHLISALLEHLAK